MRRSGNLTDRAALCMVRWIHRFRTAAVIGTGMMGPGIALTLALGGVRSTILGRTAESAAAGLEQARTAGARARRKRACSARTDRPTRWNCWPLRAISTQPSPAPIWSWNRRRKTWSSSRTCSRARRRRTRPDAVLASNTSGLSITAIASRCERPERVLTTHFWNPPHLMPLVEIVKGERTSEEVAQAVRELLAACGKTPVVVKKDRPGQLGNRLQMALVREAVNIVAEGIADAEDVDTVPRTASASACRPTAFSSTRTWSGWTWGSGGGVCGARPVQRAARAGVLCASWSAHGHLGARTGRGFYDWSAKSADEVKARRDAFLIEVLRYRRSLHRAM